jgi:hypothetical protein
MDQREDQSQQQQQQQQQHHHHHHQQQQLGGTQRNQGPPPIAPKPNGMTATSGQSMSHQGQGMTSHLMGLMSNPALGAAAAASPVFPAVVMMANPGSFFALPDAFISNGSIANPQNGQQLQQGGTGGLPVQQVVPQPSNGSNGNPIAFTDAMGNQLMQHMQSGQHHFPQIQGGGPSTFAYEYGGTPQSAPVNSSMGFHMAAAAAAAVAENDDMYSNGNDDKKQRRYMNANERAKQNRDRNREHAKSTRLRKKAYVENLKELLDGLHAERTEEVKQRRVAIQHLAETQNVRRAVIRSFLQFHSNYERDKRKWSTLLEDDFWLKQPVTPYRCFRRSEIERVRF